jgi:peptidoglycan/xylan/chitin deacetylase (PgdA/CDA1 family)
MRLVLSVIAALAFLGVAAFGIISAQKLTRPASTPTTRPVALKPGINPPVRTVPVLPVGQTALAAAVAPPAAVSTSAQSKPAKASAIPPCDKPGSMGLSRIVEIDTTGGPEFGAQHLKGYDFLGDKEVVLTFDDGPWPVSTAAVLKALADECLKATFFEIGEHASWHPQITREVIEAGMTIGTHTWSHKDLARNPYAKDIEKAEQEIEMGISAVHMAAAGRPIAPFFRFPDLRHPPQLVEYLAHRNVAIFSTDIDSRDFTMHRPQQVVESVMTQLEKRGKGIILLHDFHRNTAKALPELFRQLKEKGFKVVHMVPKEQLTTLPKYDEMLKHWDKLSANNTRPESSVVRTISN